jgi:hypothetical protein
MKYINKIAMIIINAIKNCQKEEEINFVKPLCLGNTARHLELLHPSAEELNDTRRDRVKGVLVNVNTPTFTWTKERSVTRLTMHLIAFQCNGMLFF